MQTESLRPVNPEDIEGIYVSNFNRLKGFAVKKGSKNDEAVDVVNAAFVKFISILEKNNWQKVVENNFSYLAGIIVRIVIDTHNGELSEEDKINFDDKDIIFDPSDEGINVIVMNNDLDKTEKFEKEILPFAKGFSDYELDLIWFTHIEEFTAQDIAAILNQSYEKTNIDCNRAKNKLNYRLKKKVKNVA